MKHFFKQKNKWLLSTLMIAALGSQYYYSVNSTHLGSAEMSSVAADQLADMLRRIEKDYPEATQAEKDKRKLEVIAEYQPKIEAEKKVTEAKMATVKIGQADGCTICKDGITITGSTESLEQIAKIIKAPAVATVSAKVETSVTKTEDPIKKCDEETTAADKQKCIKEARDKIKKDRAEAKAERLKEAKEIRNEEFTEKAEAMADHCSGDLSRIAEGYTSLLGRYSGSRKVDMFTVNQTFNKYIEKDLKAALRSGDSEEALATIEQLTANVPTEYRVLKNKTIDSVKSSMVSQALEINNEFKMSDLMKSANRINESNQYLSRGIFDANKFNIATQKYAQAASAGLNTANDQTSLDYFRTNFLPDMQKLIANVTNVSSTNPITSINSQTTGTDLNQIGLNGTMTTRTNGRGGSGNFQQQVNRVNGVGSQNILKENGVNFGTPGTATSGRRGSYQKN